MGQIVKQVSETTTRYYWYPGDKVEWLRAAAAVAAGATTFLLVWWGTRDLLLAATVGACVTLGCTGLNFGRRDYRAAQGFADLSGPGARRAAVVHGGRAAWRGMVQGFGGAAAAVVLANLSGAGLVANWLLPILPAVVAALAHEVGMHYEQLDLSGTPTDLPPVPAKAAQAGDAGRPRGGDAGRPAGGGAEHRPAGNGKRQPGAAGKPGEGEERRSGAADGRRRPDGRRHGANAGRQRGLGLGSGDGPAAPDAPGLPIAAWEGVRGTALLGEGGGAASSHGDPGDWTGVPSDRLTGADRLDRGSPGRRPEAGDERTREASAGPDGRRGAAGPDQPPGDDATSRQATAPKQDAAEGHDAALEPGVDPWSQDDPRSQDDVGSQAQARSRRDAGPGAVPTAGPDSWVNAAPPGEEHAGPDDRASAALPGQDGGRPGDRASAATGGQEDGGPAGGGADDSGTEELLPAIGKPAAAHPIPIPVPDDGEAGSGEALPVELIHDLSARLASGPPSPGLSPDPDSNTGSEDTGTT